MPSILKDSFGALLNSTSFKPYYNWNAFNTNKKVGVNPTQVMF